LLKFYGIFLQPIQDLSLDLAECTDETWEIQHEFLHALGFWHEMQRGDRSEFYFLSYSFFNHTLYNFLRSVQNLIFCTASFISF